MQLAGAVRRMGGAKVMWTKLKSRKLWGTVLAAAVTAFGNQLGLDPALTLKLSGIIMLGVVGQAISDSGKSDATKH